MKKVTETRNVIFYALEIGDIITMIPVMDSLATKYRDQIEEIRKRKTEGSDKLEQAIMKAAKTLNQLEILAEMGLKTSNNNNDIQIAEELGDIVSV